MTARTITRLARLAAQLAAAAAITCAGSSADAFDKRVWTQKNPIIAPSARTEHVMAFDTARGKVVLFGGYLALNGTWANDTWEWDGVAWKNVSSSGQNPLPRGGVAIFAYHPTVGMTILAAGYTSMADKDTTWGWNGSSWTSLPTGPAPPKGTVHATATLYDTVRDRVVSYGDNFLQTSVLYEYEAGVGWHHPTPAPEPPGRGQMIGFFDTVLGMAIVAGGSNLQGDTWGWDGTNWSGFSDTFAPRDRFVGAWDSDRNVGIMYGGRNGCCTSFYDTQEWSGGAWNTVSVDDRPNANTRGAMVYDPVRHEAVYFGGYDDAANQRRNETWTYSIVHLKDNGEVCSTDSECGLGFCTDGVCCNEPCGKGDVTNCQACSVAAGAAVDGVCGPVQLSAQLQCRGANPYSCTLGSVCDGSGTACPASAPAPDGTPCNDDPCTLDMSCKSGVCSGGTPKQCPSLSCALFWYCDSQSTGKCWYHEPTNPSLCPEIDCSGGSGSCIYTGTAGSGGSGGASGAGGMAGGGGVAGAAGASGACDASGNCAACTACAQAGPCAGQVAACDGDPDCVALRACSDVCSTAACFSACAALHPNAIAAVDALDACLRCTTCPASCGATGCGAGGAGGSAGASGGNAGSGGIAGAPLAGAGGSAAGSGGAGTSGSAGALAGGMGSGAAGGAGTGGSAGLGGSSSGGSGVGMGGASGTAGTAGAGASQAGTGSGGTGASGSGTGGAVGVGVGGKATAAGSGGSSSAGDAIGGAAGEPGTSSAESQDSGGCGCRVPTGQRGEYPAGVLVGLCAALGLNRRRKRR